jgi:SET domain-containing protein
MATARRVYIPGDFILKSKRSFAGIGLFAGSDIPKNACVIEYVGRELEKGEDETSKSKYLFKIHSRKTIDGKPRINKAGYINHSHKPNCEPIIHKNRIFIFAKRSIKIGEELTYDYGKEYTDEHCNPCLCDVCRAKGLERALTA